jgi:hypothetical protein
VGEECGAVDKSCKSDAGGEDSHSGEKRARSSPILLRFRILRSLEE